jgi:hypothetical protein
MSNKTSENILLIIEGHSPTPRLKIHQAEAPQILSEEVLNIHRYNSLLWAEEDLARRTQATDSEIAKNKRAIDKLNQKRNDSIQRFDANFLQIFAAQINPESEQHSETLGSMIDRTSILTLKINAMRIESNRKEAGNEHMKNCSEKLGVLIAQRNDLLQCADKLINDMFAQEKHYKIYFQFKMYNDPSLNPALYNESSNK